MKGLMKPNLVGIILKFTQAHIFYAFTETQCLVNS